MSGEGSYRRGFHHGVFTLFDYLRRNPHANARTAARHLCDIAQQMRESREVHADYTRDAERRLDEIMPKRPVH